MSAAASKRKRVSLSIATKLKIVERVENGESIVKLASEFNIGRQTVRDMVRNKDKLHQFVISFGLPGGRKTLKKPKFEDLNKVLLEWFKRESEKGRSVTGAELIRKAKWLHSEMKITEPFAASHGWLYGFQTRYGIKQTDTTPASSYVAEFNRLVNNNDLGLDQFYGAFRTVLPPKTVMSQRGTGQKPGNQRMRMLACTNASGLHKLKPVCVGKSKNPRSLRGIPLPIVYYSAAQLSWNVLKDWFFNHFVPDVRDHLRSKSLPQRAVLLLDREPTHVRENVLRTSDGQIYVVYLSSNSALKPMNHLLYELKRRYRKALSRSVPKKSPEFSRLRTVKNSILSCLNCWEKLPASTIRKSWESFFSNLMKGIKVKNDSGNNHEVTAALLWENLQDIGRFDDVTKEDMLEWPHSVNDNEDNCETEQETENNIAAAIKEELPEDIETKEPANGRSLNLESIDDDIVKEEFLNDSYTEIEELSGGMSKTESTAREEGLPAEIEKPADRLISESEALGCVETLLDFLHQEPDSDVSHILSLRELRKSLTLKIKDMKKIS